MKIYFHLLWWFPAPSISNNNNSASLWFIAIIGTLFLWKCTRPNGYYQLRPVHPVPDSKGSEPLRTSRFFLISPSTAIANRANRITRQIFSIMWTLRTPMLASVVSACHEWDAICGKAHAASAQTWKVKLKWGWKPSKFFQKTRVHQAGVGLALFSVISWPCYIWKKHGAKKKKYVRPIVGRIVCPHRKQPEVKFFHQVCL